MRAAERPTPDNSKKRCAPPLAAPGLPAAPG
jgi:hypothetical protein